MRLPELIPRVAMLLKNDFFRAYSGVGSKNYHTIMLTSATNVDNINENYSKMRTPENVVILKKLDVYKIISESDIHTTVYSTCALEAPALGIPNILINIDGLAELYYSGILTDRNVTRFVNKEEEFVNLILNMRIKSKNEVMALHDRFYKQNYRKCIKNALIKIGVNSIYSNRVSFE